MWLWTTRLVSNAVNVASIGTRYERFIAVVGIAAQTALVWPVLLAVLYGTLVLAAHKPYALVALLLGLAARLVRPLHTRASLALAFLSLATTLVAYPDPYALDDDAVGMFVRMTRHVYDAFPPKALATTAAERAKGVRRPHPVALGVLAVLVVVLGVREALKA